MIFWNPATGFVGVLVAGIAWASAVKLLQVGHAVLCERLESRLPGVPLASRYCPSALLGIAVVTLVVIFRTPETWGNLSGRFISEIVATGFAGGLVVLAAWSVVSALFRRFAGRSSSRYDG